jgi:hypothetical protein
MSVQMREDSYQLPASGSIVPKPKAVCQ